MATKSSVAPRLTTSPKPDWGRRGTQPKGTAGPKPRPNNQLVATQPKQCCALNRIGTIQMETMKQRKPKICDRYHCRECGYVLREQREVDNQLCMTCIRSMGQPCRTCQATGVERMGFMRPDGGLELIDITCKACHGALFVVPEEIAS